MSEELFDKYLSDTLTANEEEQLHDLLQDETYGQALVEYALEMYTNTRTANDLLNGNTSKERKELIKQHQEPIPLARYLMMATGVAAAVIFSLWVLKPVKKDKAEVSRIGEKANIIHGGKFRVGDSIKTSKLTHFEFMDGSKIKLSGEVSVISEKKIHLKSGKISVNAVKQQGEELVILTDDASVSVLGTSFTVTKEAPSTSVEVSEGKVRFTHKDDSIELPGGFGAETFKGKIVSSAKGLNHVKHLIYKSLLLSDPTLKMFSPMENTHPLQVLGLNTESKPVSGKLVNGRNSFTRALQSGAMEIPGTESFNLDMPCTIGAWVTIGEFENYPPILTKGDNAWRVQMNVNGKRFHVGFGANKQFINSKKFIEAGKWYFVTFVGEVGHVKVYVNGALENEKEIDSYNFKNDSTIMIGGNKTVPHRNFNGLIGDTFILQRALSSSEVKKVYEQGKSIK